MFFIREKENGRIFSYTRPFSFLSKFLYQETFLSFTSLLASTTFTT